MPLLSTDEAVQAESAHYSLQVSSNFSALGFGLPFISISIFSLHLFSQWLGLVGQYGVTGVGGGLVTRNVDALRL